LLGIPVAQPTRHRGKENVGEGKDRAQKELHVVPDVGALGHRQREGDQQDFDEVVVKRVQRLHHDHGREGSAVGGRELGDPVQLRGGSGIENGNRRRRHERKGKGIRGQGKAAPQDGKIAE
jgi:hypothetical protein